MKRPNFMEQTDFDLQRNALKRNDTTTRVRVVSGQRSSAWSVFFPNLVACTMRNMEPTLANHSPNLIILILQTFLCGHMCLYVTIRNCVHLTQMNKKKTLNIVRTNYALNDRCYVREVVVHIFVVYFCWPLIRPIQIFRPTVFEFWVGRCKKGNTALSSLTNCNNTDLLKSCDTLRFLLQQK